MCVSKVCTCVPYTGFIETVWPFRSCFLAEPLLSSLFRMCVMFSVLILRTLYDVHCVISNLRVYRIWFQTVVMGISWQTLFSFVVYVYRINWFSKSLHTYVCILLYMQNITRLYFYVMACIHIISIVMITWYLVLWGFDEVFWLGLLHGSIRGNYLQDKWCY